MNGVRRHFTSLVMSSRFINAAGIQKLYLCCCRHSPPWLWVLETVVRRLKTSRKRERATRLLPILTVYQFELLEGAIWCQPTSALIIPTWPSGAGRPGVRTLGENFLAATHFCFIPARPKKEKSLTGEQEKNLML